MAVRASSPGADFSEAVGSSLRHLEDENSLLHRMSRQDMGDLRRIRTELQQSQAEVRQLREELAEARGLRSELMAARARIQVLQSDLRRTGDIRTHNERLSQENHLLLQQSRNDQQEINAHDRTRSELELDVNRLRDRAEGAEQMVEELRLEVELGVTEVRALREQNVDLEQQLEAVLQEQHKISQEDWQGFWHRKAQRDIETQQNSPQRHAQTMPARECSPRPESERVALTPDPSGSVSETPVRRQFPAGGAWPGSEVVSPVKTSQTPQSSSTARTDSVPSAPFRTVRQLREEERRRQEAAKEEEERTKREAEELAMNPRPPPPDNAASAAAAARRELLLEQERIYAEEAAAAKTAREVQQPPTPEEAEPAPPPAAEACTPLSPRAPIVAIEGEKGSPGRASHMYLVRREDGGCGSWEAAADLRDTPELQIFQREGLFCGSAPNPP
eukprot:Hpha_TRINITY_DN5013_c0_g1::TRINITY_DN5013_c0_g1_i2::g.94011::m.94011